MHPKLLKFCLNYFRLTKFAEVGFDPLAALVQAKQEAPDQAINYLDQIASLHGQLANSVITDPNTDINQSISDLKNIQKHYNTLIHNISAVDDIATEYPSVGYFAENILNDANVIISQVQQNSMAMASVLPTKLQQKYIDAILSASDTQISDEEVAEYEEAYGLVPEGEEDEEQPQMGLLPGFEEPDEEKSYNPFEEIQENQESQKEMAYNIRRQQVLDTKRKSWHKLFSGKVPRDPELWKEVLEETDRRFDETQSDQAMTWAWHAYARAGGGWDLYKDIHAERQKQRREQMKQEDPGKYEKELRSGRERARKSLEQMTEEKKKQKNISRTKRRRDKALERRLKQLSRFTS